MEGFAVVTNKCPVIPNRGIGKPGMCYIWERMMDRVAQELNLSPIDVLQTILRQPFSQPPALPKVSHEDAEFGPAAVDVGDGAGHPQ
jgi:CO/xanthine dehydrogenase Mo-binding subunit